MIDLEIGSHRCCVDLFPDTRPYCHKSIYASILGENYSRGPWELILKCPNSTCLRAFIASYRPGNPDIFYYQSSNTGEIEAVAFSNEVVSISRKFVEIYNEANAAEQYKLTQVCGVGYRKALEYLIKDYLIAKHPNKESEIKAKFLGDCIKQDITDVNIKKVSERAVWLGNDETHYVRLWEDKNIEDLKKLIRLTVSWIEMGEITSSLENDMPNKKKNKSL